MNLQRHKQSHIVQLALLIAATGLLGCSSGQEAEPEEIIQQSNEELRTVVFDREGVLEIRQGQDVVFERDAGNKNQMPRGVMPPTAIEAPEAHDIEIQDDAESPQALESVASVPKSNVPAKVDTLSKPIEALSEETPAKLEPLPEKIAPLVPQTTFAVQVGFFGQRSNAENLRDVLTNNDWPVRLITIEKKSGKKFYLVVVPVRGDKARANAAKAKIQKQHGLDGIVIRSSTLPK